MVQLILGTHTPRMVQSTVFFEPRSSFFRSGQAPMVQPCGPAPVCVASCLARACSVGLRRSYTGWDSLFGFRRKNVGAQKNNASGCCVACKRLGGNLTALWGIRSNGQGCQLGLKVPRLGSVEVTIVSLRSWCGIDARVLQASQTTHAMRANQQLLQLMCGGIRSVQHDC
jgi:hypothetical protein